MASRTKLKESSLMQTLIMTDTAKQKAFNGDGSLGSVEGRRRRKQTRMKQCIKNDSWTSITLKVYHGSKLKVKKNNFLLGQTHCHYSTNADYAVTFVIKTNGCDIAMGFAKASVVTGVAAVITAGAVLTGGTSFAAQFAGAVTLGAVGISTPAIWSAIEGMPQGDLKKGLAIIPGNIKAGGKYVRIVGDCGKIKIRGA